MLTALEQALTLRQPALGLIIHADWSTLKTEFLPHGGTFTNLGEARLEVAYHLDTYFDLDRRHAALGYRSPHQFEVDLFQYLP